MTNSTNQKAGAKISPQKNSLIKNSPAKKNTGISRYKTKPAFSKNAYREIENIWSE